MPNSRPRAMVMGLLPSLTDVAFLLPLMFVFGARGGAKALLEDGDTGWHIRTGEWMLDNGRIPHTDIFSFTKPGQPWFAWEWLSDLMFGWLYRHWGLAGVVVLCMAVLCFTSAALYRLVSRRCSNPVIAMAFTFLAVVTSSWHWHARPHLFTLLFAVVLLHLLDRVEAGHTWLLWLLPPLIALWTNLHGGFFVGMFLVGCYAAGHLLAWFFEPNPETRRKEMERACKVALAAAACALASLANPFTYHLQVHIANYLRSPLLDRIQEFMPVSFHRPRIVTFELLLLGSLILAGWSIRRRRFADALLVIAWAHLALYAGRNISIFCLVAAPIAAGAVDEILARIEIARLSERFRHAVRELVSAGSDFARFDRLWRTHAVSAVVFVTLALAIGQSSNASVFNAHFDGRLFPVTAVPVLGLRANSRIFSSDQWGGYLIFKLYPVVRVYVDGRSDFYGNEFMSEYDNVVNAAPGWAKILDRSGVEMALLPVAQPLAAALKLSSGWRVVYDDGQAVLFARPISVEESLSAEVRRAGRDPKIPANINPDPRITNPTKSL